MSLLHAAKALAASLIPATGTSITYRRGALTANIKAVKGRTVFEHVDSYGVVQKLVSIDWLIRASDLVLNNVVTLPVAGDVVEEKSGSITYKFDVVAPVNAPPYEWSDRYGQVLRVHSKQTAG